MYSGEQIDFDSLGNDALYNIDHIFPQAKTMDDSLDNKVLVLSRLNGEKSDDYPIKSVIRQKMHGFWTMLRDKGLISKRKYERLTRSTRLTAEELTGFIQRQLVETRQSTKAVTVLLKEVFPQFAYKYQSVIHGGDSSSNTNSGTADDRKAAFSEMLRSQGKYAIAKKQNDSTGQPDPERFKNTYGHYKWDALRRFSMPENAELLLWVLPTCCLFKQDPCNILLGLSVFSKTVVFAHYAMTTRAVAALTSMEAQIRLLDTIGDRKAIDDNDIEKMYDDIEKMNGESLLKPFEKLPQNQIPKKKELAKAIKKFFKQEYARRVLTAWKIKKERTLPVNNPLLEYCKAAYWDEMCAEYLEIIDKGDPEKTIDACIDVLYWWGEKPES